MDRRQYYQSRLAQRLSRASVLYAGYGTGRVGRELARRGTDVVGLDIDPEMLSTARRKAPGGVRHASLSR